jgi:hypothetical protein
MGATQGDGRRTSRLPLMQKPLLAKAAQAEEVEGRIGCGTMLWRPEPDSNRMGSPCRECSVPYGNSGLLSNKKKPDVTRLPMAARGQNSGPSTT